MIIPLPASNDLVRISYLHDTRGADAALRYMDRVLANMQQTGSVSVIPFRTKSRYMVQSSPVHSGDAS